MSLYYTLEKLYALRFLPASSSCIRKLVRVKGIHQEGDTSGTTDTSISGAEGDTSSTSDTSSLVSSNDCPPRNIEYTSFTKSMEIDVHQEVSVFRDAEAWHC
ncbi:hypothetical protein CVT26_013821 [Gymnopilus dilepis]|uniref:Uncharacterized protein n=1 Tax=Gymnopilus dilepis TaxID=231916 RepID=A0A409Y6J5_9AGAR|nr:hypothetical protein CVT26_013821 [Gymnopilus dilepis]